MLVLISQRTTFAPLVDQQGQIAIRLNPLGKHRSDDRLAGGADDQRFFERSGGHQVRPSGPGSKPVMRDDRAFLGKPLDVFRLLLQESFSE